MRYGVLGSLEVSRDGRPVQIGGYKQRALLAILLIDRNRVVLTDRIIDRLWAGSLPASAATTLQGYLSHLRTALRDTGEDRTQRLSTQPRGYILRVGAGEVDADRFAEFAKGGADALAAGDAYGACELLDQALALWRGSALADFASEMFAMEERAHLEELHGQVIEDRMEAGLVLGWHSRLLPELQALVSRHPLRERLRGQLMLALYRSGRQVEALDVYRKGRDELAEQLGIDPGPALQQLEQAMLRQDPTLDLSPFGLAHQQSAIDIHREPAESVSSGPGLGEGTWSAEPSREPAEVAPSNVPEPLTPIIGRRAELEDVTTHFNTARLVTLTGPGGTGKTRVATEVARRLRSDDICGPWMVELAGLTEAALVPNAIAQTLRLVVHGDRDVADMVADALDARKAVLVLDNCEHLLEPVAALAQSLLASCAGLRILATSREGLNVTGEVVYGVQPLSVTERTPEARLVDGDAMRLFEARAAAVVPGFSLTAESRSVVRGICRELDGLPLAIELAAARMRLLSPEQLAENLSDRFALLSGGSRNAQPRQRALRATVEWSFDLLEEREQRLFTTLCVFSGGFHLDAVARLWDGSPTDALDLLDALVSKSLVTVDATSSPRRYGMLQTLREYGIQVLSQPGREAVALRHAQWCTELTADGESGLRGPHWRRWLRRLDDEQDNIRAAVAFALNTGRPQLAAQIIAPLGWYWFRRGAIDEARQWLERCNAVRGDAVSDAWSRVVMALGTVRYLSGVVEEARQLADEAIDIAEECGAGMAHAQATVHSSYFEAVVDIGVAERRAARGLELVRRLDLSWLESEALTTLGNLARVRGDLEAAETLVLHGVDKAHEAGYWWQERVSKWTAAKVALDRDEPEVAVERLRGVVQDLDAAGDRSGTVLSLFALAGAVARTHSATMGAVLLGAVATYSEQVGLFPERVDPVDAARISERVRHMLSADDFDSAFERGRGMSSDELAALLDQFAGG